MGYVDDKVWVQLGKKSFARFYNLSLEEVDAMDNNPNYTFHEMVNMMAYSLSEYEKHMINKGNIADIKEEISRFDLLDF